MPAWREWLNQLKGARRIEWLVLALALILAALFLLSNADTSGQETVAKTDLEARLERVLEAVDGAGKVRTMVTQREEEIIGVLVVAEGAGEMRVRLEIAQAVQALLDVELSRIEVVQMRGEEGT